jgi:hypothetical protein
MSLTGVGSSFTARHEDPLMGEGEHEHTWQVIAWYPSEPFRDARSMKGALETVLATFEGQLLPPDLWAAERFASALMDLLANCVGVDVSRPTEGFYAQVRA